jgi:hypothetical protein
LGDKNSLVPCILPHICRVSAAYLNYLLAKLDPSRLRQLSKDERDNTRTGFFTKEEFESLAAHLPEDLHTSAASRT